MEGRKGRKCLHVKEEEDRNGQHPLVVEADKLFLFVLCHCDSLGVRVCERGCVCVCVHHLTSSIAVEYPGDIEQSLEQPSAVNERMESAAYPLNSLSLYWT